MVVNIDVGVINGDNVVVGDDIVEDEGVVSIAVDGDDDDNDGDGDDDDENDDDDGVRIR